MIPTLFAFALAAEPPPTVERCLAQWDDHPFTESTEVRVLAPSVRMLGLGTRELVDTPSKTPELVVVRPSVNVMTRTVLSLHNPNGWYCIDTPVGVMSKVVVDVHCDAHVADAHAGKAVMGRRETDGGVAVLGSLELTRSCAVADLPPAEPEDAPEPQVMRVADLPR